MFRQKCSSDVEHRCFPDEPCWPSLDQWDALNKSVNGRLSIPHLTVEPCLADGPTEECEKSLEKLGEDPFYLQQFPGGSQQTGNWNIYSIIWLKKTKQGD